MVKTREPFDLARTPLVPGTTLIEASAGTGKTFALANLFLRLLLEHNRSVHEILVVTYTEAATEELRGRIRDRLAEATATLRAGAVTEESALREILLPYRGNPKPTLGLLDRALCSFDETPIFTIHGFCHRTLRDRAFESGALFDTELLRDDAGLLQEVADDFWREQFYEAAALPVQFALQSRCGPEGFLPLLRVQLRQPTMTILSPVAGRKLPALLEALTSAFAEARVLWNRNRDQIDAVLEKASAWGTGDYAKPDVVAESRRALLQDCFDDARRTVESLDALSFFAAGRLSRETRKNASTPNHPFFAACQRICDRAQDYRAGLQLEFLDYAARELPRRKLQRKVLTFEDLLTRLCDALRRPGGRALAAELRMRYPVALIDEFQDTDPVQYAIFRAIFQPPDTSLFFIGDPKQAIYGFRGADVFTYLDAARTSDRSFTLGRNFRSESALVDAVNSLFGGVEQPFLLDDIVFDAVAAAGHADQAPLLENGHRQPPLQFWFMPREDGAGDITKDKAERILPATVATEIARLLNEDVRVGDTKLTPRDIAVLVLENRQAALMQDALRALNIPSVLHTEASVFESREARELRQVLTAAACPTDARLIRAALATDLLGATAPELDALADDESGWQQRLEAFHAFHELWKDRGFMPMFRQVLQDCGVRRRLLHFTDGERRLTNLLHLGEAVHQAVVERRLEPTGAVRWLAEQIASEDRAKEEHQLRLERDDQAVRLVTIHKSKGLEYPVVFCPFSWKSAEPHRQKDLAVYFHERGDTESNPAVTLTRFICDLGSENLEAHRELAFEEQLAESLRLLYVSLTRARNRCYFVWGGFKNAGTSAMAWLLHPVPHPANTSLRDAMSTHFKNQSDDDLLRDLHRLVERATTGGSHPGIVVEPMPRASTEPYRPPRESAEPLRARKFTRRIARDWRILSFSGLAAGRRDEEPDYDTAIDPTLPGIEPAPPAEGVFAFPRGTQAGTCLHKIFEAWEFTDRDDRRLRSTVSRVLAQHGLDSALIGTAYTLVQRALAVPLVKGNPNSALRQVPKPDRLTEVEFCFPLRHLTPTLLAQGFTPNAGPAGFAEKLRRLEFQPAAGFVKGYIDLVFRLGDRFYVVDWKSNWLGNHAEDYAPPLLAREMAARLYPLQYHLYTVALHRYLGARVPDYDYDRHFGGVRYVFLRGVDPDRPALGIFEDRPDRAAVEHLNAALSPALEGIAR